MHPIRIKPLHFVVWSFCFASKAFAHPIPDIPVRATFLPDGMATIRVEVDPRCFVEDALNEPYFENAEIPSINAAERKRLFSQAATFIRENVELWIGPARQLNPPFEMRFTSFNNQSLPPNPGKNDETPVMITAEWKVDASAWTEYWIRNPKTSRFSLQFINTVDGREQPLNVLFPGEESYKLALSKIP